jgi:uncharacterized membrane protein (DUF485 family)
MAGFDAHGNTLSEPEHATGPRAARFGRILFACYAIFYGAFVLLNAFASTLMQNELSGISIAVWYGLALIAAAFAMALVYDWLCRLLIRRSEQTSEESL